MNTLQEKARAALFGTMLVVAIGCHRRIETIAPEADARVLPPPPRPRFEDALEVGAAGANSCARTKDGNVWCWGDLPPDQLDDETKIAPVKVTGLHDAADLAVGDAYSCVRTTDGGALCWGRQQPEALLLPIGKIAQLDLAAFGDCVCFVDGKVGCWHEVPKIVVLPPGSAVPKVLHARWDVFPVGGRVLEVRSAATHGCVRFDDGKVTCWGLNGSGVCGGCGVGPTPGAFTRPTKVPGITDVVRIALGLDRSCAITKDGRARCWGSNDRGRLGDGSLVDRMTPTELSALPNVTQLALGDFHGCALTVDGAVWCWGSNAYGELGDATMRDRATPAIVPGLPPARQIAAGAGHTCALLFDGTVACWGRDDAGQLGHRKTSQCGKPEKACAPAPELVVGVTP